MTTNGLQIQNFLPAGTAKAPVLKGANSILASLSTGKGATTNSFDEMMASLLKNYSNPKSSLLTRLQTTGQANAQTTGQENASLDSIITDLKKFAQTKFGKIDNITINKNKLAELREILQAAGLNTKDIDSFLSRFKDTDNKIKLSDILTGLEKLDIEKEPVIAEIAMLPFIETQLNKTGLKSKTISDLITDATSKSGINISKLAKDIKNLQHYQESVGKQPEISQGNDNNQNDIFSFVKKLEKLIHQFSRSDTNTERVENLMASFTDKLEKNTDKKADIGSQKNWGNEKFLAESSLIAKGMNRPSQQPNEALKNPEIASKSNEIQQGKQDLSPAKQDLSVQDLMKRIMADGGDKNKSPDGTQNIQSSDLKTNEFQSVMRYKQGAMSSAGKSLPEYVENHVSKQLARAVINGTNEVKFHIKPPDLGRIQMNIHQAGHENFKVTILAEQSGTRDMIQAQIQEIRQNLADTGIKIDKIDVQLSGNFGQSSADDRYSAANSGKNGNKKGNHTYPGKKDSNDNTNTVSGIYETRAGPGIDSSGRLYLVA